MKRIILSLLLIVFLSFLNFGKAFAITSPLDSANNRFGIHIIDENDLDDAQKLINSNGGQWGYVKMVINEGDRDAGKWQMTFNRMRRKKLIPIIRLATHPEGENWAKPKKEDIKEWVDFLNSLNWVVQNRYVILFNEPNHAKEWGGELDPAGYAEISKLFIDALKERSDDFFILPAGFDASASNSSQTIDMANYIRQMIQYDPQTFNRFDGWTSHSYPNPNFSGSPYAAGRGTVKSFLWEVSFISQFTNKNLPVFITETGWNHKEGKNTISSFYTADQIAENFKYAFENVWNNNRIVTIIPFVLNYQDAPFDHFSWRKIGNDGFYPQYETVQNLPKIKGLPNQINDSSFTSAYIPDELISFSDYEFDIEVLNTGQSIWNREEGFYLEAGGDFTQDKIFIEEIPNTEPIQKAKVILKLKTPQEEGDYQFTLTMKKGKQAFGRKIEKTIKIIPPPSILIRAKLWFKKKTAGDNFTLLIYDKDELKKKFENIVLENGSGQIKEVRDIIPSKNYRFVLLKPFYLPRQTESPLWHGETTLIFDRMLPFDWYKDGKLSLKDFMEIFKHPLTVFGLLFPF